MTRDWPDEALDALHDGNTSLGHGPLDCGVRVIRVLCKDGIAARSLAGKLRALLYQSAGLQAPSLGRMPH